MSVIGGIILVLVLMVLVILVLSTVLGSFGAVFSRIGTFFSDRVIMILELLFIYLFFIYGLNNASIYCQSGGYLTGLNLHNAATQGPPALRLILYFIGLFTQLPGCP